MDFFYINYRPKIQGHLQNSLLRNNTKKYQLPESWSAGCSPNLSVYKVAVENEAAVRHTVFNNRTGRHFTEVSSPKHGAGFAHRRPPTE